ncbi:pyridoxamine 5'-phosphate oxidase family protein [Paenibacillus urinalis]|uniref:pyridoxamine 5'-phosphate oxidase family protein n=1 Tax=Paenibacillus urinalis TaxID=521520 RepID=UPI001961F751
MNKYIPIPAPLLKLLDGEHLPSKQTEAFMLQTVTEDGWPHTAMISVGEIVAIDAYTLRLALWCGTTTSHNMLRSGKAELVIVYAERVYYLKMAVKPLAPLRSAKHERDRFTAHIHALKIDQAKYAHIEAGIRVQLIDPDSVVTRWMETVEELRMD